MENQIANAAEAVEEVAHSGDPLLGIAIAVAVAAIMGLGFMRLRQPPLVGFILAGLALGPTGLGVIQNSENVSVLAEMGVVVLLFFIGMELSIKAFMLTVRQATLVAGGQLLASMALAAVLALWFEASVAEWIILGFIIALSSTVVAMKMLDGMGELRSETGRVTVGVLIAQDLAVIPMLILVSSLGGATVSISEVVFKVIVAVALLGGIMWWFGNHSRLKLPYAASIGENVDLLALGALALCFTAAALSGVAGLSPVYGAFLAGIIVGNSNLRARVIPVIEPIQSILVVVFFLSIGLLIDLDFIVANIGLVLFASLLVIGVKTIWNIMLLRATGSEPKTALLAGLSMAQVGEFSFVLAAAGLSSRALGYDIYRLAIAMTAVSLLVSPIWFNLMERIERIAASGLGPYREALRLAYEGELGEVERGRQAIDRAFWWGRLRYRAGRFALYQRRARKAAAPDAPEPGPAEPETPEPDAPEPAPIEPGPPEAGPPERDTKAPGA
ncbi:cation:proton antiporter [Pseudohoeflea coraliihabitans]|uniref:Cation:proton antiporter n=1 Tax=Pseudohoeflea coraliihabitans TaxID=2860393 RepID=A0ABS6WLJ4_9HYPH|nr:cation:proton antiporter [Pseudohoeflea sp. DP4N28-3]MBW3095939.1 cation:proton antiporter [Pseudohoeflea sp. DP4N28-3]